MSMGVYLIGVFGGLLVGYGLRRRVDRNAEFAMWERAYREGYAKGRSDLDYFPPEMIYRGNRVE